MIDVSAAYRESMKSQLRNRGYIKVAIGVIPMKFVLGEQQYSSSDNFTYYTNLNVLFKNLYGYRDYGTLENHFTKVDGSMFFLPRETSDTGVYYDTGVSSENVLTDESLDFGVKGYPENAGSTYYAGLTVDFGENYPVNFDIILPQGDIIEVRGNTSSVYHYGEFRGVRATVYDEIRFEFYTMRYPNTRLRIYSIYVGDGLVFSNEEIKRATYTSVMDEVESAVIQQDLSVDVINQNNYDLDDPECDFSYFQPKANVGLYFGYELPSGTIEWLAVAPNLVLSDSSCDRETLTINACEIARFFNGMYNVGRIHKEKADAAFADVMFETLPYGNMGYEGSTTTLFNTPVNNPIPKVRTREAIQMIANLIGTNIQIYHPTTPGSNGLQVKFRSFIRWPSGNRHLTVEYQDMLSHPVVIKKSKYGKFVAKVHQYKLIDDTTREQVNEDPVVLNLTGDIVYFDLGKRAQRAELEVVQGDAIVKVNYNNGIEVAKITALADNTIVNVFAVGEYKEITFDFEKTIDEDNSDNVLYWDNPLVHDPIYAESIIARLEDYYNSDEYSYGIRAYPELEVGDVVYQKNPYRENMMVRIVENTINYDGAFTGHLRVRRIGD